MKQFPWWATVTAPVWFPVFLAVALLFYYYQSARFWIRSRAGGER